MPGGESLGPCLAFPRGRRVSVTIESQREGRRTPVAAHVLVLTDAVDQALAAERSRIAQDLHDSVGQVLTGIGLVVGGHLAEPLDPATEGRLREVLQLAERASGELRQAIEGLLQLGCRGLPLEVALVDVCRRFERQQGLPVAFRTEGGPVPLECAEEDALVRVAHEALVNVARHSGAGQVAVELLFEGEAVSLIVRDDGVGLGRGRRRVEGSGGFGLRTMQRRIEDVGGELRVVDAVPHGVVVEAVIPQRKRTVHGARTRGGGR
jgi:signal transduction histidine kinase